MKFDFLNSADDDIDQSTVKANLFRLNSLIHFAVTRTNQYNSKSNYRDFVEVDTLAPVSTLLGAEEQLLSPWAHRATPQGL